MSFFINIIFFVIGILFVSRTDITVLRRGMHDFGILAPLVYILVYTGFFIVPINPVPKNVLTYFALASFGPAYAIGYTAVANIFGVTINYLWAKKFEPFLPDSFADTLTEMKRKKGWLVWLISRVLPISEGFATADLPSYGAGLIKMPYLLFIFLTIIPWLILDTLYFYGLNLLIIDPAIMGIVVAIMIFSLSITILRFLEKR